MVERGWRLPAQGARPGQPGGASCWRSLGNGDIGAARQAIGAPDTPEARVGLVGLSEMKRGRDAVSEAMASAKSRERLTMERRLGILGTLGNNAPFIGLFGTVLGIIKAFADLAQNQGAGGAAVVMRGISEALVATAVGPAGGHPGGHRLQHLSGARAPDHGRIDTMAHLILSAAEPAPRARAAGGWRLTMAGGASAFEDDDAGG